MLSQKQVNGHYKQDTSRPFYMVIGPHLNSTFLVSWPLMVKSSKQSANLVIRNRHRTIRHSSFWFSILPMDTSAWRLEVSNKYATSRQPVSLLSVWVYVILKRTEFTSLITSLMSYCLLLPKKKEKISHKTPIMFFLTNRIVHTTNYDFASSTQEMNIFFHCELSEKRYSKCNTVIISMLSFVWWTV